MANFYEGKLMKNLQSFGEKLAGNQVLSSISDGMQACMGIILGGSFFQIIAVLLTLTHLCTQTSDAYNFFMTPYNMTMGLLSVAISFAIAFNYSKRLHMKTMMNGLTSMIMFLLVASPATTVTLADGKTTFTGLDTTSLGGTGLFAAFLIAILSVRITYVFEKYHIVVKMPDSVPQFLQDSFSALIPLTANVLVWEGINTIVTKAFSMTLPIAINTILALPLRGLTSVPGIIILGIVSTLLWSFGIHGDMTVNTVLMPVMVQAYATNAALVAEGKPAIFAPVFLYAVLRTCGGTGNLFPLTIMALRAKSEQLRAISKVALVPGIFTIGEPITFGFPIICNPIMVIPFILNGAISMLIVWVGFLIGFFNIPYVMIVTVMPIGVQDFLVAMSWHNIFIPVVAFIVGWIVYYPFFKIYDAQLAQKEKAIEQETLTQTEPVEVTA